MVRITRTAFFAGMYSLQLSLLISAEPVHAGLLIVDWGGDYVSTTQDLQGKNTFFDNVGIDADGGGVANDSIGGRLFSESTAMNPASGYSGTSGTFYGGAITAHSDSTTSAEFGEFAVQNQGPNDELHVHFSEHGHFHDVHMAMYWDQADFLGSGSVGTVTLDETSSVTIDLGTGNVENLDQSQVRLLVRDELGNYWLSETVFDSPNSSDNHMFTWDGFTDSSDGNWAAYDPNAAFPKTNPPGGTSAAGSDLRFDQDSATYSEQNFSSITAIGYYFEQDTFHNNLDFHIVSFEANAAVAIPEPSTVTLLGMSALGLLGYRRRKRKLSRGL